MTKWKKKWNKKNVGVCRKKKREERGGSEEYDDRNTDSRRIGLTRQRGSGLYTEHVKTKD